MPDWWEEEILRTRIEGKNPPRRSLRRIAVGARFKNLVNKLWIEGKMPETKLSEDTNYKKAGRIIGGAVRREDLPFWAATVGIPSARRVRLF